MPKISVIVPVYKAEDYLADCIGSILGQTFSDFELLLVDDGSPDRSGAICDAYAAEETRITVLHQKNTGQAAARNHAMTIARGEWICFVDSDDRIHPQMLELLYQAAQESGAPISMCEMLEGAMLPECFFENREAVFSVLNMDEETLLRLHDEDHYPAWVACAKLIRRELVEDYPFREGRVFEDNEAVCRWICQGKVLAKMEHQLYFYRKNPDSTTKSNFSLKKLDYLWALESIIGYYGTIGYDQLRQRFIDRYVEAAANACQGARYLLKRPDVAKQVAKQAKAFLRRENIQLRKAQFELLLDAAHPYLIRLYWPLEGVLRTLKAQGVSGVMMKMIKQIRKGEGQ